MTDFTNHTRHRPKFLNLFKIRMPVTAVVSILHRLSGVLIFILLPFIIYGLGLSLKNEDGFQAIHDLFASKLFQLLLLIALSSIFYHLLAGIRFLLMDLDIGHHLKNARNSSWLVVILSTLIFLWLLTRVNML